MSDSTIVTSSAGAVTLSEGVATLSEAQQSTEPAAPEQVSLFEAEQKPAPAPTAQPPQQVAPPAPAVERAQEAAAPEPAKPAKLKEKSEEVDLLLAKLAEQNEKYGALIRNQMNQSRVEYLRSIGANLSNDSHLLMLSPEADVSTPEGRAIIDNWKNGDGSDYFTKAATPASVDVEELTKSVRGSRNGTFKPELLKQLLAHNLRSRS